MHMRTVQPRLRPIVTAAALPAALVGLALAFASSPALAQQWNPEQRAACEPDAMRLCQQYVPDVGRTRACMIQYRRYLSPRCRAVIEGGRRGRR